MATTDLRLEECGTLPKPGPVGRLVRLLFGALCLYYVYGLWGVRGDLMTSEATIPPPMERHRHRLRVSQLCGQYRLLPQLEEMAIRRQCNDADEYRSVWLYPVRAD